MRYQTSQFITKILWITLLNLWIPATNASSLEKLLMPGPVSSIHAEFEDECSSCHSPLDDESQGKLCVVCHEGVGEDITSDSGFHGKHPDVANNQCQSCHAEHEGRDAQMLEFNWELFSHDTTDFPLLWAHSDLECESCHSNEDKHRDAPKACVGCHTKDDPHKGSLGDSCDSCHSQKSWQAAIFDHRETEFPLTGQHKATTCESCHTSSVFAEAPRECIDCHQKDDVHKGTMDRECQSCHNTTQWKKSSFNHNSSTSFKLTGGHNNLACASCHTSAPAAKLNNSSCQSCHAKDDVHKGSNGAVCANCHNDESWETTTFDHAGMADFPLLGAHEALSCDSCHQGSVNDPLPNQCVDCHEDDPHSSQLGDNCASCHNETAWKSQVRFDHDLSPFPLLGAHGALECSSCHESAKFKDVEKNCVGCHADEDVHKGSLGTECGTCHNPNNWQKTRFDHGTVANFPLEGVHANLACSDCHAKGALMAASASSDCIQCHRKDDPHEERFGDDCAQCHSTDSFADIRGF